MNSRKVAGSHLSATTHLSRILALAQRARRPPACRLDGGATLIMAACSLLRGLLFCFLLQGGIDLVRLRFRVIERA
jgi:hypothetical protein